MDDFTSADLTHARVAGADLTGVRWSLSGTIWPPETDVKALLVRSGQVSPGSGVLVVKRRGIGRAILPGTVLTQVERLGAEDDVGRTAQFPPVGLILRDGDLGHGPRCDCGGEHLRVGSGKGHDEAIAERRPAAIPRCQDRAGRITACGPQRPTEPT
jgi:hypothetical protein